MNDPNNVELGGGFYGLELLV